MHINNKKYLTTKILFIYYLQKKKNKLERQQYDLEQNDIVKLSELQAKTRWISRFIVLNYIYNIFPQFKGSLASLKYLGMKTWFYNKSIRQN